MAYHPWNAWPLPFGEPAELEFVCGRASVVVTPAGSVEDANLEVAWRGGGGAGAQVSRVGNVVHAEVARHARFDRPSDRSEPHISLRVPREIRARLRADAGSVEVRELGPCDLTVQTGAGRIALADVYGRLRLSTGAGQIAGDRIGGSLDLETHAGAILLTIGALDPGEHRVHAGTGAIRIELARDLDAQVVVQAERGSSANEYPSRPNAAATLIVSSDTGSVRVRQWGGGMLTLPITPPVAATPRAAAPDGVSPRLSTLDVERILQLVAEGRLSAQDAASLLKPSEPGR